MVRISTRAKEKNRARQPNFTFTTRALNGEPTRDTEAARQEKQRLIEHHIRTKGVTNLPLRKPQ